MPIAKARCVPPPVPPRQTAQAAASDFITPGSISEAAVAAYVAAALAADPVRVDWTRTHQWGALDPAQVRVPTLVLHGERVGRSGVREKEKLMTAYLRDVLGRASGGSEEGGVT